MKKKMFLAITTVLIVLIAVCLYKANQLTSIQIIKSVKISRPQKEVFDMVRYLNNFPKWSPFIAQDPSLKYEVKGNDGFVGAQYHWNGNKGNDLGYQEIMEVDTFRLVRMKCTIQKPFVAQPTFDYHFTETPDGIEVTQDFRLQSSLVSAFFLWVFGAKAEMEKTNQQGLDLLKKVTEK